MDSYTCWHIPFFVQTLMHFKKRMRESEREGGGEKERVLIGSLMHKGTLLVHCPLVPHSLSVSPTRS
jgi:hypothetical protein